MDDLTSNDEHHRSTSLMSLPPDILDKIFEKVTAEYEELNEDTIFQCYLSLVNLSHVCRATREYTENKFGHFQLERMVLAMKKSAPTNTIEGLLKKYLAGWDVDATINDYFFFTLLHIAALEGYHNICKLLLFHNANVDQTTINCDTPLHLAAMYGREDVIETLLDGGADRSILNNLGKTAREECDAEKYRQCYILLGGDASELDSESESDESEVSGSHSSWDSDDS